MRLGGVAGSASVFFGFSWIALTCCSSVSAAYLRRSLQVNTSYLESNQDRVASIDQASAQCIVGGNEGTGPVTWTEVDYYYAIYASSAVDQTKETDLQSILWSLIQTSVLWCTLPPSTPINVGNSTGGRKLQELMESDKCE